MQSASRRVKNHTSDSERRATGGIRRESASMSHRNLLGVNAVYSERQSGKPPCMRWPSWAGEEVRAAYAAAAQRSQWTKPIKRRRCVGILRLLHEASPQRFPLFRKRPAPFGQSCAFVSPPSQHH